MNVYYWHPSYCYRRISLLVFGLFNFPRKPHWLRWVCVQLRLQGVENRWRSCVLSWRHIPLANYCLVSHQALQTKLALSTTTLTDAVTVLSLLTNPIYKPRFSENSRLIKLAYLRLNLQRGFTAPQSGITLWVCTCSPHTACMIRQVERSTCSTWAYNRCW